MSELEDRAPIKPLANDRYILTLADLTDRQAAFFPFMDGALIAWWITHEDGCSDGAGHQCDCDLVAWFSTPTSVFGVDSALQVHKFRSH